MKKRILLYTLPLYISLNAIELAPISVTTTKLEESLTDSASSVDVVNSDKIELSKSKDIKELSSIVSNANISGIGNKNSVTISLRGISNYVAYESSVALYVDDVPIPFSYGFGMIDMQNIQSLELLKGGQGTLFGKGAQSGVINIYTKAPTKEIKVELSAGYSSYNTSEFYGSASGATPIENLNYALSITKSSSDGYSINVDRDEHFDTKDFLSFTAKLHYQPTSSVSIALNYSKSKSDDGGAPYKANTKDDPFNIKGEPIKDFLKMQTDQLSLAIKYQEDGISFSSISSFARQSIDQYDYVGILGGLDLSHDIEIEEITQEFRYKQKFENSELLVGAFYSDKIKFDYKENQTLLTLFAVPLSSLNSLKNPDKNMALFTQYRYYIDEHYSIMGGLRYQETKRSFERVLNDFGALPTSANSSTSWRHFLPTLSFSYYGDDDSHSYFTYSKGYRAGGYGYRSSDVLVPFEPETTDSYELGYKKSWGDSISFNSVLFYNDITNHRINTFTDTLASIVLNANRAYSYGLELSFNYSREDFLLYGSFGLTKAKFEKFGKDEYSKYNNNNLIEIPNITLSLGLKYNINDNFYLTSSLRYMGERYYNIENSAKADAYTVVNIGAGYERNGWLTELYATNIFDKEYVDFMIYTPTNNYYHFGTPQIVGIKISKKF